MKKIIDQGLILIFLFFGIWFSCVQFDWVSFLKIQKVTDSTEQKLGDLLWREFKNDETEIKNPIVLKSLDTLVNAICTANKIDRSFLKIHVLLNDEINAFALPNGHLIVYSGLILNAEKQEELTGVICHEIAHIEKKHVMKKLINEIGLSVLISLTTNRGGTVVLKETTKLLSSTAFDRSLEKEADIKAVDYLIATRIDPNPFANFLYKLSEVDGDNYFSWLNTHPDSKQRAMYILDYFKNKKFNFKPILTNETWLKLNNKINY